MLRVSSRISAFVSLRPVPLCQVDSGRRLRVGGAEQSDGPARAVQALAYGLRRGGDRKDGFTERAAGGHGHAYCYPLVWGLLVQGQAAETVAARRAPGEEGAFQGHPA